MSLTELFLFRHGETDWNRELRFQGHTDIPLNETGVKQAFTLKPKIQEINLDLILTSDLVRARRTAEIVAEGLSVNIVESKALRECVLGEPEGLLREELFLRYGEASWERWRSVSKEDFDFRFPGGESKLDHLNRLVNFLESYCKSHPQYKRIGISTHGGSIRRIVHHCEGAPTEPVPLPNCVLYKVSLNPATNVWNYLGPLTNSSVDNLF